MKRLEALGQKSEWVFSSRNGTPVNAGNVLRRYIQPAAEELGIDLSGFHDFRHTLATDLINGGVLGKAVSNILGHAMWHNPEHIHTSGAEGLCGALNSRAAQYIGLTAVVTTVTSC